MTHGFFHTFTFLQRIPQAWFLSRPCLYETSARIRHILQTIRARGIVNLIRHGGKIARSNVEVEYLDDSRNVEA